MFAPVLCRPQVSSWEEGLALLQSVRPKVKLNARQQVALEAWVQRRRGGLLQMQSLGQTLGTGHSHGAAAATDDAAVAVTTAVERPATAVHRSGLSAGSSGGNSGSMVHLVAEALGPGGGAAANSHSPMAHTQGHGASAAAAAGMGSGTSSVGVMADVTLTNADESTGKKLS